MFRKILKNMKEKLKFQKGILNRKNTSIDSDIKFPENPNKPQYSYDIEILVEVDERGNPVIERQDGIISDSDENLVAVYAMCGQRIRILNKKLISGFEDEEEKAIEEKAIEEPVRNTMLNKNLVIEEPKFIKVSGINIKIVGDKVYQKQWIKASDEEASTVRIVNTETNKIVSMKNRHVELEKWILVEEETS